MTKSRKIKKREYWPPLPKEQLQNELEIVHKKLLRGRINRTSYVYQEFGPSRGMLLPGGLPSLYSLHEMRLAYIEGLYLSAILCAHVFVEQTLGGQLIMGGEDKAAEGGLNAIALKALELTIIDPYLFKRISNLRKMRVAYSHSHVGLGARSHMKRILATNNKDPEKLLKQDAKTALQTVSDLLQHKNPGFWPSYKISS